jgi:hypothetical protein
MKHKKLKAAIGIAALAGGYVFGNTLLTAEAASTTTIYAYLIDGSDPNYSSAAGLNGYYWYQDLAVGIWNADPQQAETWGGDAVTVIPAASCPAQGDYCIYATEQNMSAGVCGNGSYYAAGVQGAGIGRRGYLNVANGCAGYTQEQRITIVTHELGHALGIPFDSSTDPTDLMSDKVFPTVQAPTYSQYQTVGNTVAAG